MQLTLNFYNDKADFIYPNLLNISYVKNIYIERNLSYYTKMG